MSCWVSRVIPGILAGRSSEEDEGIMAILEGMQHYHGVSL